MGRTAVVFSPIFERHIPGRGHPESPRRAAIVAEGIENMKTRLRSSLEFVRPTKASMKDVELVHALEYIRLVEAVCRAGGGFLDYQDTVASRDSFEVALYAVGATVKAVKLVMEGSFENGFALVRPPGHHAERFRALGFCIFNNVAIAAQYLIEKLKLSRVLVLDVDAHHGNGTQQRFYDTDRVLYISLHEDPTDFPGTGLTREVGRGEGVGYNVNVPFPYGTGDGIYLRAVEEIVIPIVCQYEPEFILVSAGFDGHYLDPVGNLSLSALCIQKVYETIADLASSVCQKRLVCVLEGGYNLNTLGRLATIALAEITGIHVVMKDKVPAIRKGIELQGELAIKEAKKAQKPFWKLD